MESSVSAHVQATLSKSHSDNGPENSVSRASHLRSADMEMFDTSMTNGEKQYNMW